MEWKDIDELYYVDIKKQVDAANLPLPDDYCKLIGPINGAYLDGGICKVPGVGSVPYLRNIPLSLDTKGNAFILYNVMKDNSMNLFPFGSVGNGDYFCFDLDNKQVVFYQHEYNRVTIVCDSFTEFLSILSDCKI